MRPHRDDRRLAIPCSAGGNTVARAGRCLPGITKGQQHASNWIAQLHCAARPRDRTAGLAPAMSRCARPAFTPRYVQFFFVDRYAQPNTQTPDYASKRTRNTPVQQDATAAQAKTVQATYIIRTAKNSAARMQTATITPNRHATQGTTHPSSSERENRTKTDGPKTTVLT